MDIPAKYDPSLTEDKWYSYWLEHKIFHSEPDEREPYSIVIPPPNVTGVLHMGHMMNNTIQDVLIRRARMLGKNACWVPGTDHASIATEAKVVARLKEKGIEKSSLSREQFLEEAWKWKEEHGGIILKQLRKLGASCDWDRTRFTMEPALSKAVINTFVYFYKKGLIYRGVRMVNWDPVGKTAVSDEEVIHKDTKSKLYYLRYFISDGGKATDKYIVIATTRPETIMADAAVCINPNDERYHWLRGKKILIPLINKEIPIIEDDYVTMDFGTGCLKVTPAHDINDYEIGLRHKLPVLDIIDDDGCLNEKAQILVGQERFQARKNIVKMLEESGNLEKTEDYNSPVGHSERTDAVIEPKLSLQWFLKMEDLAAKALKSVEDGKVRLIPDRFTNTYRHWMETVRDWCISRQLWWGQQIPAYYTPDGECFVAATKEEAFAEAAAKNPGLKIEDLRQDEDVLDTWFSSWLWPISVFDPEKPGFPDREPNKELAYYFPTNDLITAPDILFFWVARMIMAADEFEGKEPFSNVYLTGIVRDKLGRKMSKTLGNSPDPLVLIKKYGADAVRVGMLLCSSAGNDIFFDESQVEQGRNFCNKIWNAFRLIQGWEVDPNTVPSQADTKAVEWFESLLNKSIATINDHFSKFRISDATMTIYKLFWDEFCAWYLEAVKPAFGEKISKTVFDKSVQFFDSLLKLLHPFMPFITEELWQNLSPRQNGETIMRQMMPKDGPVNEQAISDFEIARGCIINIRNIRQSKQISPKQAVELFVKKQVASEIGALVSKLANVSRIEETEAFDSNQTGVNFMVGTTEFFVPVQVDVEAEKAKIEAEIKRYEGFLTGVRKKLSNERFVSSAPKAVVDLERKKESDALEKLKALDELLQRLK
ncbi:MAG: valine--tRNA ligase [Bacteroidales bacterium]|nr:valine--tRNA ligase [Bacteroidales bacterium]